MMREAVTMLLVAASGCGGGGASEAQQFDGEQAHRWVVRMDSMGPRIPNTPAHRAVGDWLVAELRARADTVIVQEWVHVSRQGDSLRMRNIFARFRPAEASRVLFVSHWDSKPHATMDPDPAKRRLPVPGANDGGSSTALLLGVADQLKRQPPAMGVDLLFVDGEDYGEFDGDEADVLIGSRWFAAHMPPGYAPLYAVLWDMIGDYNQQFKQEGYSLQHAPEVVERVWNAARDIGLSRVFVDRAGGSMNDDHVPLQRAGLRIIDVIDCCNENYPYWHTTADTPDKVSPRSLSNAGRVAMALIR
jgi:hypothetical protein